MKKELIKGNEAVIKAAILAGCRSFYGYPITPASEIAEAAAKYFSPTGGTFLQAESEVAAINMVYGAAAVGERTMTASSGPGLSLMQEGISYLAGSELPCVIVDITRGGPGLGNIAPEQSDYHQIVKGGGHGNYHTLVFAPNSCQEMCDLAAIGGNEILHAANRGEAITVFFVNNAIYGMTGGQMAPTSLMGMRTTTSPRGRDFEHEGFPLRVSELLASLDGPTYIERVALYDNKSRARARKAVRKAIQNQIEGRGFSLVEILSPCPTGWGLQPTEACEWVEQKLAKYFPLGVIKDESARREGWTRHREPVAVEQLPALLGLNAGDEEIVMNITQPDVPVCYRDPRVKIAGFGGQGLLFLGKLIAEAGMRQGYHVSWLPSYGPEMRGGTANCAVNISTEPIGSPLVSEPTVLIAMNRPSLDKFEQEVTSGGLIIYDSSLIDKPPARDDLEIVALPATRVADEIGNSKAANMVALGGYIGTTGLLDLDGVIKVIQALTKKVALVELNIKAINAGLDFARNIKADECLWGI
jgi:2-oxoisovalerate ferredoxin oxidoreductase beta subunit